MVFIIFYCRNGNGNNQFVLVIGRNTYHLCYFGGIYVHLFLAAAAIQKQKKDTGVWLVKDIGACGGLDYCHFHIAHFI